MKVPMRSKTLLRCVGFLLGGTTILCANWLELNAEHKVLSSFPMRPGSIAACSWVAVLVLAVGLFATTLVGVLLHENRADATWSKTRSAITTLAGFLFGVLAGGVLIPAR